MSNTRDGRGRSNPWKRGRGSIQPTRNLSESDNAAAKVTTNIPKQKNGSSSAQAKFLEAKSKMEEAVNKHKMSGYESSSEEEELESENILGKFALCVAYILK